MKAKGRFSSNVSDSQAFRQTFIGAELCEKLYPYSSISLILRIAEILGLINESDNSYRLKVSFRDVLLNLFSPQNVFQVF